MKYGIVGWYGYQNLGDEMLLECVLEHFGRHQATIFTPHLTAVDNIRKHHNVESSTIKTIPDHDLDYLIFGGGGVFHDLTIEWYFPKSLMEKIQCPILMLCVGIPSGEGCSTLSRTARYFVEKLSFISFRGAHSQKIFSDLWKKDSYLLPDLVFLLEKQNVKKKNSIVLQVRSVPKSYDVITPRDFNLIARKQYADLDSEFRKQGFDPKFLIFSPKDTVVLPDNCETINCFDDIYVAVKEISSAEAVIGTRLHCCVIAMTQHTPFKAYRYQGKIDEVIGIICNSNRIIYPKRILQFDRFYPIEKLSSEEESKLGLIQTYLRSSLDIIRKAMINHDFKNFDLPKFPIPQTVSATYQFSKLGHKPKPLRDIRDWLYFKIGKGG